MKSAIVFFLNYKFDHEKEKRKYENNILLAIYINEYPLLSFHNIVVKNSFNDHIIDKHRSICIFNKIIFY